MGGFYYLYNMNIVPPSKPKMTKEEVEKELSNFDVSRYPVRLLGIRGYYSKSMGKTPNNERNIYDDAIFIVSPDYFCSFNANTDPSITRKGIAVLKAGGVYLYKIGLHNMKNPYKALRQHGRVTVLRDGKEDTDTAKAPFYIDIHKGGFNTTSSLGCQTIYPKQWIYFLSNVEAELEKNNQTIIPYCLIEM